MKREKSTSRARVFWILALPSLGVIGVLGLFLALQTGALAPKEKEGTASRLPKGPVSRPKPPPAGGYVGSQACRACHAEICETYAQHPMGRSAEFLPTREPLENYAGDHLEFAGKEGFRYRVEKTPDQVIHHEIAVDSQGAVRYDLAVPIGLAIGSGIHGKSYAVNRDGILFQSPISWYATDGGRFDVSPGYQKRDYHFSRRWTETCLICHIGRTEDDSQHPTRTNFRELAIGCERCHGPGEKHVKAQENGAVSAPDATIINPSRLPVRERESVCYHCHLHGVFRSPRYGRRESDFRPGMALEEIVCVLVKGESASVSKSVSQVEQMWASTCFRQSTGKMGCISCHDPHQRPAEEKKEEFYRARCNECHSQQGCSLPLTERQASRDSCIACHMPRSSPRDIVHASLTDHSVPRRPRRVTVDEEEGPDSGRNLQFFDHADERIPAWDAMRTRGMQRVLAKRGEFEEPGELEAFLLPLAKVAPDDAPLFFAVGTYYLTVSRLADARTWYEKSLGIDPNYEASLANLALVCQKQGDKSAALGYIDRVIELNPSVASHHALRAEIMSSLGDKEQADASANKALNLDPSESQRLERLLGDKGSN